jgi:3-hydroxyisobutyrate dehydrogenase-like beta-hydroxyacid dehydrogenase
MAETIGIIGVGRMGQPMVKHLVKRGYDVIAHDVLAHYLAIHQSVRYS